MITLRKATERGHANHGWLDSYHTFSFANYYDPAHMGFRALRVINQDRVTGGMGFGTHGHRDMEIISYVLDGELEHKDSMGHTEIMRRGDVQRVSAGTGILHSEYNHSKSNLVHFLQIWILPDRAGVRPSYDQKFFTDDEKRNQLRLIVSPDGRDGSITIQQDANIYATLLDDDAKVSYEVPRDRYAWIQVARGKAAIDGQAIAEGDGIAVETSGTLEIVGVDKAELLVFDLA